MVYNNEKLEIHDIGHVLQIMQQPEVIYVSHILYIIDTCYRHNTFNICNRRVA